MGKSKRNCRRTSEETRIHEQAVKIRKMTDEQLIKYIENREDQARNEGKEDQIKGFFTEIQTSKIPGIGAVTINKLLKVAKENGYIQ